MRNIIGMIDNIIAPVRVSNLERVLQTENTLVQNHDLFCLKLSDIEL